MMASVFVTVTTRDGDGEEGKTLTPAQAGFEKWLREQGYEAAVEVCPYDGQEGGYQGTVDAADLIFDFLGEHESDDGFEGEIRDHAFEIGEISNLWNDELDGPDEE